MPTLTPSERLIRSILIDSVTGKLGNTTISYRELGEEAKKRGITGPYPMVDPPFRGLGEALGVISIYEHAMGRPLLSSVVVTEATSLPGDGFVKMAESLGRVITPNASSFCIEEQRGVVDFWNDPDLHSRISDAAFMRTLDLLRLIRRDQRRKS